MVMQHVIYATKKALTLSIYSAGTSEIPPMTLTIHASFLCVDTFTVFAAFTFHFKYKKLSIFPQKAN